MLAKGVRKKVPQSDLAIVASSVYTSSLPAIGSVVASSNCCPVLDQLEDFRSHWLVRFLPKISAAALKLASNREALSAPLFG